LYSTGRLFSLAYKLLALLFSVKILVTLLIKYFSELQLSGSLSMLLSIVKYWTQYLSSTSIGKSRSLFVWSAGELPIKAAREQLF